MTDLAAAMIETIKGDTAGTAEIRYGTIAAGIVTSDSCPVEVAGAVVVDATYLGGYIPRLGDKVMLLRQGATWIVVSGLAGFAGNRVVNPDFAEIDAADTSLFIPPLHWSFVDLGSNGFVGTAAGDALFGRSPALFLGTSPAAGINVAASSAPIPVEEGQRWRLQVVRGVPVAGANGTSLALRMGWYAEAADTFPNTSAADSVADSETINLADEGTANTLLGEVTVPSGAAFGRLTIRLINATSAGYTFEFRDSAAYLLPEPQ